MAEPGATVIHFFGVEDLKPLVYIVSGVAALVVAYSLYEFYRRVFREGFPGLPGGLRGALARLVKYWLLQYKVLRHRFPGSMHAMIFYGMLWLFMATNIRAFDSYVYPILQVPAFFYLYKFLSNVAGTAVILGSLIAITRRVLGLTPRLPKDPSYYVVLLLFIFIALTGFMLNGMVAALYRADNGYENPLADPVGYLFYATFNELPEATLLSLYRATWVTHLVAAQLAIALIPFTNLWHIPAVTLNIAMARPGPPAASIRSYPDLEERIEKDEPIGIVKLKDATWKQLLDYESCTSCMRCTNACPAAESGKLLDPRGVIFGMRRMLREGRWDDVVWDPENPGDGSRAGVNPEAIWSCVTCGACVNECPVLIHHVDTIIDVRRGMLSTGSNYVPEGVLRALESLQYNGNPIGANPYDKEQWFQELVEKYGDDIIAREGEEYDYLYWVGCITAHDPRIRPVAESIIELLRRAGVKVAVMPYTGCSGEPALRMGEEALFIELMKMFLEELSRYKFKKLLVNCPHCFNVFRHDYKRYRGMLEASEETRHLVEVLDRLEVEHHSTLLARLVREGKLKPSRELNLAVTYHDPCYLGRWNGVYEEPREVVRSVKGLRIREMPRNRERSFCCGGGGGHLFFEVKRGNRISALRSREAADTLASAGNGVNAKVVAVACPFCNTMFRAEAENYNFEVKDIAEILRESLVEENTKNSAS